MKLKSLLQWKFDLDLPLAREVVHIQKRILNNHKHVPNLIKRGYRQNMVPISQEKVCQPGYHAFFLSKLETNLACPNP